MKTFLPSFVMTSTVTVPMVTVATQTDGCVEMAYQALCTSSAIESAIDIYEWEDEFEAYDFNGDRLRVMSSQTDLALSDFDLNRCLELEDEEEEEAEEEEDAKEPVIHEAAAAVVDDQVCHENDDFPEICVTSAQKARSIQPRWLMGNTGVSKQAGASLTCETLWNKSSLNKSMKEAVPALPCQKYSECFEKQCSSSPKDRTCRSTADSYHGSRNLGKRMAQIRLNDSPILETCEQETRSQQRFCNRNRLVPRMGTKIEFLKQLPERQVLLMPAAHKDSVMHLKPEHETDEGFHRRCAMDQTAAEDFILSAYHSDSEKSYTSARGSGRHKEWSSDGDADCISQSLEADVLQPISFVNSQLLCPETSCNAKNGYEQFADIMYTNEANLHHTIMVQQSLFKQQMANRRLQDESSCRKTLKRPETLLPSKSYAESEDNVCSMHPSNVRPCDICDSGQKSQLEWIVKRRPDGTRYITRRPVRSKLLKERAKQLAAQHDVHTTDDDNASEIKIGRYWSKDERKRHLEKARIQKRQKENLKMHACSMKEEAKRHDGISPVQQQQQHKLAKQHSRKILVNFTTLKELKLPGASDIKGKTFGPLLSVTTI